MVATTFTRAPRDSTNGRQHRQLIVQTISQLQDYAQIVEAALAQIKTDMQSLSDRVSALE